MEFLEDTVYDEDPDDNILPTEHNRKNLLIDGVFKPFMLLLRESNQKHLENNYHRNGVDGIRQYFQKFGDLISSDTDPSSENVRVVLSALTGDNNELFNWEHDWMSWESFEQFVNSCLDSIDMYMYECIRDIATPEDYEELKRDPRPLFSIGS